MNVRVSRPLFWARACVVVVWLTLAATALASLLAFISSDPTRIRWGRMALILVPQLAVFLTYCAASRRAVKMVCCVAGVLQPFTFFIANGVSILQMPCVVFTSGRRLLMACIAPWTVSNFDEVVLFSSVIETWPIVWAIGLMAEIVGVLRAASLRSTSQMESSESAADVR